MDGSLIIAIFASTCLLAAVWIGVRLRRFVPAHHLSPDSRDTVKLATGLVATMSALLLGLLVNTAKTTFDTTRTRVIQTASKFALLDRLLAIYGPPAAQVRGDLPAVMEEATRVTWPDELSIPKQSKTREELGNAFYVSLLNLEARNDTERALKAQCVSLSLDLGQIRSLMEAESTPSISRPLLAVVVLWLVIVFIGFSLMAPPNATATFALVASACCAAGAIFMILELDRPFSGIMRISSEPMLHVLQHLQKQGP